MKSETIWFSPMTHLLFSGIVPAAFGAVFVILNLMRMRLMRQYLAEKPRSPDSSSENTRALSIGRDTVYVTEREHNSFMRRLYFSFILLAIVMFSIVLSPVLTKMLRL